MIASAFYRLQSMVGTRAPWALRALLLCGALALAPSLAQAQYPPCPGDTIPASEAQSEGHDIIMPHLTDSHEVERPYFHSPYACAIPLPRWKPIHVGSFTVDLSPTKHVVWLLIAAGCCVVTLLWAAAYHRRRESQAVAPGGFAAGVEAVVLYLRQTVVLPNVGPHPDAYTSYILSIFFFILFANLAGLIPYGSTPTGNISVTAAMAAISFVVIEISGMRALGRDYWKTIIYWNKDLVLPVRIVMAILMSPIEVISKFAKPFALTIRLFANMIAGHVVLLAFIILIFTFKSYFVALVPVVMGVADSLLEIFVAFLQAYIFALLTAVFIGQIRLSGEHH
jgi:F-type H+-transporting ATPase subunit a